MRLSGGAVKWGMRGGNFIATATIALLAWATAIVPGERLLRSPDVFSHIAVGRNKLVCPVP